MFHFKHEKPSIEESRKLISKAFSYSSTDKKVLIKTDVKVAWIYLFGYKISKVKFSILIR